MSDAFFLIDSESRVVSVNRASCLLLGKNDSELVGKPIGLIFGEYKESNKLFMEVLKGNRIKSFDFDLSLPQGKTIPASLSATSLTGKEGIPIGAVCIVRDISEQKAMQEEKERIEEELYQSRKLESIGQLAGRRYLHPHTPAACRPAGRGKADPEKICAYRYRLDTCCR